ncbi:MAG TPA: hypothetical protein VNW28_04275 [Chthoniobacterales bacterium]|nr:hypothetical protein [Chthoniobacterales bacterium]
MPTCRSVQDQPNSVCLPEANRIDPDWKEGTAHLWCRAGTLSGATVAFLRTTQVVINSLGAGLTAGFLAKKILLAGAKIAQIAR